MFHNPKAFLAESLFDGCLNNCFDSACEQNCSQQHIANCANDTACQAMHACEEANGCAVANGCN